MLNYFNTYFDARITECNTTITGTANDFLKIDISLDDDELPENQKDKRYILRMGDYEEAEVEANYHYEGDVIVTLRFLLPNSDTTDYQAVIDNYVHVLMKLIRATPVYNPSNDWTMEVRKAKAGIPETEKDEQVIKITMEVYFIDTISVSLAVPSVPILTVPTDAYASGTANQSFNWTGTATTWDFELTLAGVVIISQTGLTNSSFTVPLDITLATGTYSWRVRGRNDAGIGDWATAFTFTVAGDSIPDFRTGLVAEWDADLGVTSASGLVSAWLDQVGGYNLIQATAGLKPTLTANALNTTKSVIETDGTNYMDIASAINLVNFTVIAVFKSDNATPAGREFIFGGSVQGIMGMATVANGNHTYGVFSGGIRSVAYSAGDIATWHIRSFQNTKLYSNGVEGTYNSTGATPTLSLSRLFCRGDNTTQTFTGKLARFRIYSGNLSDTNRAIAETYLNSVYAIY